MADLKEMQVRMKRAEKEVVELREQDTKLRGLLTLSREANAELREIVKQVEQNGQHSDVCLDHKTTRDCICGLNGAIDMFATEVKS